MTNAFKLALVWILATLVAIVMSMNSLPQSLVDGQYIPVGFDAFYHARRILDAVNDPSLFYQFDPRIHYPEGSWIAWPWGYDYLVAQAVRAAVVVSGAQPTAVLMYVPLLFLPVAMLCLIGIARELRLSLPFTAIALLGFAVSPLTKALYGVGMLDHHSVEQLFVLATLWCGMAWMRSPHSLSLAVVLGVMSGVAVAFHNGLFLLQAPLLAALVLNWWQRRQTPRRSTLGYGIALVLSTILVAMPSAPFRQGSFDFHLLSWFHVWMAAVTAILAVALVSTPRNPRGALMLCAIGVVAAAPVIGQLLYGLEFVSSKLEVLQDIDEARSPVAIALSYNGPAGLTQLFGYLVWLAPAWLVVCFWQAPRDRDAAVFWITAGLWLLLLVMQIRFQYYASFALYLVPLVLLQRLQPMRPWLKHVLWPSAAAALFVAMLPPLQIQFLTRSPTGGAITYDLNRSIYPALHEACRRAPGLVLASWDDGNFIRYHSECSVLANNFMLTPEDLRYAQSAEKLLSLTPEELVVKAPEIRYVFVKLTLIYALDNLGRANIVWGPQMREVNTRLPLALLMDEPSDIPASFRLLHSVTLGPRAPGPIAALYEIRPPPRMSAGGAAN